MTKSYIVSGSLFGDEGKGTLSDYLSNKYDLKENVRYNGGSQASHTVINNGVTHKFSQLGSSFLNEEVRTYLSDNTIINPFNIITEAKNLSNKINRSPEEILSRIYVDNNSSIVTPYHSLLNKIRELSNKNYRTGSVGTGVSEVKRIKDETGIELLMSDLYDGKYIDKLLMLFDYTSDMVLTSKSKINPKLFEELISEKDLYFLTNPKNKEYLIKCYKNLIDSNLINRVSGIKEFHKNKNTLFEGSQGFLIDYTYGIRPNTTWLDTTNLNGVKMANSIDSEVSRFGAISAMMSRHGMGLLPTRDMFVENNIYDENQSASYYQGKPRYGWFDCVLARYSLRVAPNDELFMSALDRLSVFENIKICDSYIYTGEIDEEFESTFVYYKDKNRIIIKDIKKNTPKLRKYLSLCIPYYIEMNGWNKDISNIEDINDLPKESLDYISMIEYLIKTPITLVGVGADRCQKLERRIL